MTRQPETFTTKVLNKLRDAGLLPKDRREYSQEEVMAALDKVAAASDARRHRKAEEAFYAKLCAATSRQH